MLTRRTLLKTSLAAGAAATIVPLPALAQSGLTWEHFPADDTGFLRAPVLVKGSTEAVLIDGGFTLSDGQAVADAIQATGLKLTIVYVSVNDPDY